jgi:hypothetical protein
MNLLKPTPQQRRSMLSGWRIGFALNVPLNIFLALAWGAWWNLAIAAFALMMVAWTTRQLRADRRALARKPDYALIAAMEREVYGEAFRHDGAPEGSEGTGTRRVSWPMSIEPGHDIQGRKYCSECREQERRP